MRERCFSSGRYRIAARPVAGHVAQNGRSARKDADALVRLGAGRMSGWRGRLLPEVFTARCLSLVMEVFMNQHRYLRAYMAGIVAPTVFLLIGLTVFCVAR